ncbi:MAG TPA: hypothetical protein VGR71_16845 [Nitrospira sp.]|nr:hypothetical protein [Nitrospira sp.]
MSFIYRGDELQQLISKLKYKPGLADEAWFFQLAGRTHSSTVQVVPLTTRTTGEVFSPLPYGSVLQITVRTKDSCRPGKDIFITHTFAVPSICPSWKRWLIERICDVERHETMEGFWIDDSRPFYPDHVVGANLYEITEKVV